MSIFSLDSLRRVRQLHHKIDQMRYRHWSWLNWVYKTCRHVGGILKSWSPTIIHIPRLFANGVFRLACNSTHKHFESTRNFKTLQCCNIVWSTSNMAAASSVDRMMWLLSHVLQNYISGWEFVLANAGIVCWPSWTAFESLPRCTPFCFRSSDFCCKPSCHHAVLYSTRWLWHSTTFNSLFTTTR